MHLCVGKHLSRTRQLFADTEVRVCVSASCVLFVIVWVCVRACVCEFVHTCAYA